MEVAGVYLKATCYLNDCKKVCHHNCPSWSCQGGQDVGLDLRTECPVTTECQGPVGHDDDRVRSRNTFVHVCPHRFTHSTLNFWQHSITKGERYRAQCIESSEDLSCSVSLKTVTDFLSVDLIPIMNCDTNGCPCKSNGAGSADSIDPPE